MEQEKKSDFILVPRVPTEAMLKAGWYEAHDEDAGGCWRVMVEEWEKEATDRERAGDISPDLDSRSHPSDIE
jgi:hypothetical protein